MSKILIIFILFFVRDTLAQKCEAENQYAWSYHGPGNNPDHWYSIYPDCGQTKQSPINIEDKDLVELNLPQMQYTGFGTPLSKATVKNVGWTVMITPEDGEQRYLKWGDNVFILDEIHFHFGEDDDLEGAENLINYLRYDMEVHFVTHLESDPASVGVLAVLLEGDDTDNAALSPLTDILSNIKYRDDSTELQSDFTLADMFPENSGSYYYYDGSNSIPPCQPGYFWFVLKDIGNVGRNQLKEFTALYSVGESDASDSCRIGPNYRYVQQLDDRPILTSD